MARKNLCPNPTCGANTTGWGGSATFARATGLTGLPTTTGVTVSVTGFVQPADAAVAPGDIVTVSFYFKNHSGGPIASGKQVFIGYRTAGGDQFPENFNTAALGADGAVTRASFTTAAAPAGATAIFLTIDQVPVNVDISSVLIEKVPALDSYFDGNTPGAVWDGAANNSTSTIPDAVAASGGDLGPLALLHRML